MSSSEVWPDSRSRRARSARLTAWSSAAISRARSPSESQAPDCTRDSRTRRFTSWIADVRSQRSSSDLNIPSASRRATMLSTACRPTFLIAARPNKMLPRPSPWPSPLGGEGTFESDIEKSVRDLLISGACTSMPRSRQSTIAVATRSAFPSMFTSSAVMYSSG